MIDFNHDDPTAADFASLVSRSWTFEDGDSITVIQVKRRDDGPWITYTVQQGPGIPRKLMMPAIEFVNTYGHLFE